MTRKFWLSLFLLAPLAANAQSVQQSGNVTPGHAACWAITGVVYDCGSPGGGVSVVGSTTQNDFAAFNGSGSLIDSGINPSSTSNWSGLQNFNGGATAPTRPSGDNTTSVATTAYVNNLLNTTGLTCVQSGNYATQCINTSQTPAGNVGASNFILNQIVTAGDTAAITNASQGILLEVGYNFGGATMTGNRTGLLAAVNQTATTGNTSGSGILGNYVGILTTAYGQANDNGTSSCNAATPSACRGAMFGANFVAELHGMATYWSNITGLEDQH